MSGLVLSLFPGIGMLDHAFELEGFTVVRGPDPLWGGDIREFHPPAGRFDGVIGGPPCPHHSTMRGLVELERNSGKRPEDLIPEYQRAVFEAQPTWWISENARDSYAPKVGGYRVWSQVLDNRSFGQKQRRQRRISFGTKNGRLLPIETETFEHIDFEHCVLGGHGPAAGRLVRGIKGRAIPEMLELQGLPGDFFDHSPFTVQAQKKMIGNGVPIPMGRAIARAVKKAIQ